jgi:hypothetical protein
VLLSEHRACPHCVTTRVRCELGVRPCAPCREIGNFTLIQECILDCTVMKRACKECRENRRACEKKRPCHRCIKKKLPCTPFNSQSSSSSSSKVYYVSDVGEALRFYTEIESSSSGSSSAGGSESAVTLEDETSFELSRIRSIALGNSLNSQSILVLDTSQLFEFSNMLSLKRLQ